jgi:hypothetical protein
VSVLKEAHALPESISNKSLFTYYECDACNQAFGEGCENDPHQGVRRDIVLDTGWQQVDL